MSRHNSRTLLSAASLLAFTCLAAHAQTPASPNPATPNIDPPKQTSTATDAPLNPALPTLFIIGDSTARNQADLGWGDHFAHYFDTTRINVANRAVAGRSYRTYINEGRLDKALAEMKPGDYVMLQMGHNDGGDLSGAKPRGDLKGIGPETQDIPQTSGIYAGKTETLLTFGGYARRYIAAIRAKGATPIMLTITIRNIWKDGQIERDMGYDGFVRQIAEQEHVPVVDMANVEADRLQALGPEKTALLFPIDHTHTSPEGAERNAESVAIALRNANSPLVKYLKPAN